MKRSTNSAAPGKHAPGSEAPSLDAIDQAIARAEGRLARILELLWNDDVVSVQVKMCTTDAQFFLTGARDMVGRLRRPQCDSREDKTS